MNRPGLVQENEQLYKRIHGEALQDDFSDVNSASFLSLGADKAGRPAILLVAKWLPPTLVSAERVFRSLIAQLDETVNVPFVVIYVHTGAESQRASLGALWLRQAYERCARRCCCLS